MLRKVCIAARKVGIEDVTRDYMITGNCHKEVTKAPGVREGNAGIREKPRIKVGTTL